jgi:hypothetical protein
MPVLQAMDGKFYDIPDDEAVQYEVPREKVKELLEKSGAPTPQGGSGPSQGPGPRGGPGPGQGQGQGQGHGPGPGQGAPPPSVLVQIYGAHPGHGGPGASQPPAQQPPPQQGEAAPGGEGDGDVNPYWWWRNVTFYRPWGNYWPNWGNW